MAVMGFRGWGGCALAAALAFQTTTANALCVTEGEAKSLGLFVAPDMIRGLSRGCRPMLPGTAYLTRSSETLIARYRPESSAAWTQVQTFLQRFPEVKMLGRLDEPTARALIAPLLFEKPIDKVAQSDCIVANQLLEALDPLPPQNVASLLIAFARLEEAGITKHPATTKKQSIFCPAVAR